MPRKKKKKAYKPIVLLSWNQSVVLQYPLECASKPCAGLWAFTDGAAPRHIYPVTIRLLLCRSPKLMVLVIHRATSYHRNQI